MGVQAMSWTHYFLRITGVLGLILGLMILTLVINFVFPNLKRLPHWVFLSLSGKDVEVVKSILV